MQPQCRYDSDQKTDQLQSTESCFKDSDLIFNTSQGNFLTLGEKLSVGDLWRTVGDHLGFSFKALEDILKKKPHNPGYALLAEWGRRDGSTFLVLREVFRQHDLLDMLEVLDEVMKDKHSLLVVLKTHRHSAPNNPGPLVLHVPVQGRLTLGQALEGVPQLQEYGIHNLELKGPRLPKQQPLKWSTPAHHLKGYQIDVQPKSRPESTPAGYLIMREAAPRNTRSCTSEPVPYDHQLGLIEESPNLTVPVACSSPPPDENEHGGTGGEDNDGGEETAVGSTSGTAGEEVTVGATAGSSGVSMEELVGDSSMGFTGLSLTAEQTLTSRVDCHSMDEATEGQYQLKTSICVKYQDNTLDIPIHRSLVDGTPSFYIVAADYVAGSIDELLEHYRRHPLPDTALHSVLDQFSVV